MAMTKDELKAMVDETIVANGQKGITAESLNNALTEIISAVGEGGGSGDGLLRVIVPDVSVLFPLFAGVEGNFTPAVWAELKADVEASGEDISALDTAINEAFAHNAEVYKAIKEKAIAGEGCLVLLDQTPLYSAAMQLQFGAGTGIDNFIRSASQPAEVIYQLVDYNESAGMEDVELIGLIPLTAGADNTVEYPPYTAPGLLSDGGLIFTLVNQTLYLPEDSSVVLPDEQKTQNGLIVSELKNNGMIKVSDLILNKVSSDGTTTVVKYSFADYSLGSTCIFKYFDGLNLMQASIVADTGETTVEVLGSLTAPTA